MECAKKSPLSTGARGKSHQSLHGSSTAGRRRGNRLSRGARPRTGRGGARIRHRVSIGSRATPGIDPAGWRRSSLAGDEISRVAARRKSGPEAPLTWVDGQRGRGDDRVADAVLRDALVLGVVLADPRRLDAQHGHGQLLNDHVARRLRQQLFGRDEENVSQVSHSLGRATLRARTIRSPPRGLIDFVASRPSIIGDGTGDSPAADPSRLSR